MILFPGFTQVMIFHMEIELKKFSVDTLEYFVKILVVSARLVNPYLLNLASGS